MKTTKIRFGLRSKNQVPLFMLWREYYIGGEMDFAEVIFSFGYPKMYREFRKKKTKFM